MTLTLDLDFLAGPPLDPRITFSRRGAATYFDNAGVLKYAAHNSLRATQDFGNAGLWGVGNGGTVTVNAAVAPDSTTTADRLNHNTAGTVSGGNVTQNFTDFVPNAAGAMGMVYSVYAKAGTKNFLIIGGPGQYCWFDINTGVIGTRDTGTWSSSGIQSVGGGWYRCYGQVIGATSQIILQVAQTNGSFNCTSPGDIYLWGAQVEHVTTAIVPSTYFPVGTDINFSGAPRFDWHPVTHAIRGFLIEAGLGVQLPSPQNFSSANYTKSGITVTNDQIAAPDGTTTADRLTASATLATIISASSQTAVNNEHYNFSVYTKAGTSNWVYLQAQITGTGASTAKAWFNLNTGGAGTVEAGIIASRIEDVGGGWYRLSVLRLGTAGTPFWMAGICDADNSAAVTVGRTVYFWGANFAQQQWVPTSYFPNLAVSSRRQDELASMTGTNFSSWYNPTTGTFIVEFILFMTTWQPATITQPIFVVDDGTSNNIIQLFSDSAAGNLSLIINSGGLPVANMILATGLALNTLHRCEIALAANNFSASLNGGAPVIDTSGAMPVGVNRLLLGYNNTGPSVMSGYIQKFQYYNAVTAAFGKVWTKVAGVWKEAPPKINVAGIWKTPQSFVNVGGTWKRVS